MCVLLGTVHFFEHNSSSSFVGVHAAVVGNVLLSVYKTVILCDLPIFHGMRYHAECIVDAALLADGERCHMDASMSPLGRTQR